MLSAKKVATVSTNPPKYQVLESQMRAYEGGQGDGGEWRRGRGKQGGRGKRGEREEGEGRRGERREGGRQKGKRKEQTEVLTW